MDAAIVGAGPAGARAAWTLARAGARVTIFDPSHPREKPCGGGVTGRALALVADALDVRALPRTEIRTARFVTSGALNGCATVDIDRDALIVAARADFDAALLDAAMAAGADLRRERVLDVAVDGGGARLTTSGGVRRADVVIGADGANSLVRRRLAGAFRRDQLSIATGFFAHGVTSDAIVIEFVDDPPGYIWSFPRPTHLAIGICAQADAGVSAGALRARAADWIARTGIARGAEGSGGAPLEPYSWPIPSLNASDAQSVPLAGPRWAVAGDAAGLVDPMTREGIYFALLSGEWAAQAALGASAPETYASRVRDEIGAELARAARLKAGFFRPAFTRLLIRALQQSGRVRDVMADLVAGTQSYRDLQWRLVQTFEVGLAWRMLSARNSRLEL